MPKHIFSLNLKNQKKTDFCFCAENSAQGLFGETAFCEKKH
jgi:hypothetical protein